MSNSAFQMDLVCGSEARSNSSGPALQGGRSQLASPVLGSVSRHAACLAPVNLSCQLPKLSGPDGQTLRRAEVGPTGIWELRALSALLGFIMF